MFDKIFHRTLVICGIFLFLLLFLVFIFSIFDLYMDLNISSHGFFALFLGCFFSLVIVGGLSFLVFMSHQKGFDEQVINTLKKPKKK